MDEGQIRKLTNHYKWLLLRPDPFDKGYIYFHERSYIYYHGLLVELMSKKWKKEA